MLRNLSSWFRFDSRRIMSVNVVSDMFRRCTLCVLRLVRNDVKAIALCIFVFFIY